MVEHSALLYRCQVWTWAHKIIGSHGSGVCKRLRGLLVLEMEYLWLLA